MKTARYRAFRCLSSGRQTVLPLLLLTILPFGCAGPPGAANEERMDGRAETATPESVDAGTVADGDAQAPCSEGGFCSTKLPVRRPLVAVAGSSADDVWAAGGDVIVHWDGSEWNVAYQYKVPTSTFFESIWVPRANDVWALGNQLLVHYRVQAGLPPIIQELPLALAPSSLSGSTTHRGNWLTPNADALWAVRGQAPIQRFTEDPDGGMTAEGWSPALASDSNARFTWVRNWGFSSDDGYVTGVGVSGLTNFGAIGHYDGNAWTITPFMDYRNGFRGVQGVKDAHGSKELWVTPMTGDVTTHLLRFTLGEDGSLGEPARKVPIPGAGRCIPGGDSSIFTSSTDAWFSLGCLVHQLHEGELAVRPLSPTGGSLGSIMGIWASSADDVWVVGTAFAGDSDWLPASGFAVHRTKDSQQKGEQP